MKKSYNLIKFFINKYMFKYSNNGLDTAFEQRLSISTKYEKNLNYEQILSNYYCHKNGY